MLSFNTGKVLKIIFKHETHEQGIILQKKGIETCYFIQYEGEIGENITLINIREYTRISKALAYDVWNLLGQYRVDSDTYLHIVWDDNDPEDILTFEEFELYFDVEWIWDLLKCLDL